MSNIFDERRLFLATVGLGVEYSTHICGIRMSRKFIRLIVTFSLILAVITQSVLCINGFSQGFAAILFPFDMILTYLSVIIVYMSLNPEKVNNLLDYLQSIIDISTSIKCFFHCKYSDFLSFIYTFSWISLFFIRFQKDLSCLVSQELFIKPRSKISKISLK